MPQPWRGDLDGMRERERVRMLVPYSRTLFFIDRGPEFGVEYEFGKAFESELDPGAKTTDLIRVVFLPVSRDQLLPWLVDFAARGATGVKEVLVTGPEAPPVTSLDGLAGQAVHVRRSSSYREHLATLNESLRARGLEPIERVPIDESLEDEDLLEMVNAGLLPWVAHPQARDDVPELG